MALPLANISWRVSGTLRPLFRQLDPAGRTKLLDRIGFNVLQDVKAAAIAKWPKLGYAFAEEASYNVHGAASVEVGTSHVAAGIRQTGGPISAPGKGPGATGARMLTIPVAPEAKGKTAGQLRKAGWTIFAIPGKPAPARFLLGYRLKASRCKRKRKGKATRPTAQLLYVLKKSVYHPADPWFPSEDRLFRSVSQAVAFALGR